MQINLLAGILVCLAVFLALGGSKLTALSYGISENSEAILTRTGDRFSNQSSRTLLRKKITQADLDLEPAYFIGLQIGLPLAAAVLLTPLVLAGVLDLLFLILPALLLYLVPQVWLNGKVRRRVAAIEKDLPDFCITFGTVLAAGADFLTAITEVAESMPGELSNEFLKTVDAMATGDSRNKALGDMAARCGIPDLTDLVRKIDQAQRYGTPLADAVRLQAEQILVRRRNETQKKASELTIKMLPIILLFCLLPMLGLLFYPVFYHLSNAF